MKLLSLALLITLFTAPLMACNTMEGVGEDVRAAGDSIDDSAERHTNY